MENQCRIGGMENNRLGEQRDPGYFIFCIGASGSGVAWLLSFVILIISTLRLSQAEKGVVFENPTPRTNLNRVASTFFVIIAMLFVAFPYYPLK